MYIEEVHLWRGSAEQQALRPQFGNSGHFAYFDEQLDHPEWRGKSVLDFGGNTGGLLLSQDCTIQPELYFCVDVLREALNAMVCGQPPAQELRKDSRRGTISGE